LIWVKALVGAAAPPPVHRCPLRLHSGR